MKDEMINTAGTGFDALLPVPPALDLDPDDYMADLDGFDLTDAQKTDLLQTLWSIMGRFVEMGFRADACGQILGFPDPVSDNAGDGVGCSDPSPLSRQTPKG